MCLRRFGRGSPSVSEFGASISSVGQLSGMISRGDSALEISFRLRVVIECSLGGRKVKMSNGGWRADGGCETKTFDWMEITPYHKKGKNAPGQNSRQHRKSQKESQTIARRKAAKV
jgi:hypothetical protein